MHKTFELSLQLCCAVLSRLGTLAADIYYMIQKFRAENYAPLTDVIFSAETDPPPERLRGDRRAE